MKEHDVTGEVKDKVRTVHELEWSDTGDGLQMRIVGSGFLYNMVRIIAGTLLDVGTGKFSPGDIEKMILAKNRDAYDRDGCIRACFRRTGRNIRANRKRTGDWLRRNATLAGSGAICRLGFVCL